MRLLLLLLIESVHLVVVAHERGQAERERKVFKVRDASYRT